MMSRTVAGLLLGLLGVGQIALANERDEMRWGMTAQQVIGCKGPDCRRMGGEADEAVQGLLYSRPLLGQPAELRYLFCENRLSRVTYTTGRAVWEGLVAALSADYGPPREQVRGGGEERLLVWHTPATLITLREEAACLHLCYSALAIVEVVEEEPLPPSLPQAGGRAGEALAPGAQRESR